MNSTNQHEANQVLPYDPGQLPIRQAPEPGESFSFTVEGLPPYKDRSRSIRNPTHPRYSAFIALRRAAIDAMAGRAWFHGHVNVRLTILAKTDKLERSLGDYFGGVLDTLDGSHGKYFTYLPIVYEDDRHVSGGVFLGKVRGDPRYRLTVDFVETHPYPKALKSR